MIESMVSSAAAWMRVMSGRNPTIASGLSPAVLVLALLAGCSRDRPAPPVSRTVTLAVRADVTGFFPNPPIQAEGYTIDMNRNIFDTLLHFDRNLGLQPGLAERWETPDDLTYVFDLRPGLRFSDGRPLTARDVAASLNAVRERGWITRDLFQAVVNAEAQGERCVIIRTRYPYFALLPRLTWGFVLPAGEIDKPEVPHISSGPYRLVEWSPGRGFTMERNPYYWGPPPAFDRARFVVAPDDRARIDMVLRGEADIADAVPLDEIPRLRRSTSVTVVSRAGIRVILLCLRTDAPPFADHRVREAVDLAIDRVGLVRTVFGGQAQPASQLVPPQVFGYDPHIVATTPDRDRARRLLAEAGLTNRLRLRLDGPTNRYVRDREVLVELSRQLGEAGITVDLNPMEKTEFFTLIDRGASQMHLLGYACTSGDAGEILEALLHSPAEGHLGSYNSIGLSDPQMDRLIDESNRAPEAGIRAALLQRALARASELRVALPLYIQTESAVVSRRIRWEAPMNFSFYPADMRPLD